MLRASTFNHDVATSSARARTVERRWRELTCATLGALVLLSVLALTAQASTRKHKVGRPPGAVRLPKGSLRRVSGVVCGKVHGRWIPGTLTGSGDFISDAQQARDRAAAARRGKQRGGLPLHTAKLRQLLCARAFTKAGTDAAAIATAASASPRSTFTPIAAGGAAAAAPAPAAPAPAWPPVPDSQSTYVPPQFFGQHLMYNWDLNPAIPVRAMRLWDSNTEWCEMDSGTASNEYDFGQLDALLGQASRVNADVEFTFGGTPQWAATGSYPQPSAVDQCSGSTSTSAPADESYWTNFVTALVTHAKGKIHAYELWNEVDYSAFWSGDLATMVRMSVDAAAIIHRIDPSALVLSPSITGTSEGYAFLHQYLTSLPPGTIDAIAVHSYTGGAWPEDAVLAEMSAVRAALPAAYASTPIWSTEGGWGLNSQFSAAPSDQMAFVARYDLQMLNQGVVRSYWYAYQNTQWGTLWDGSELTPAGVATSTINAWLVGATFHGCATDDGNLWLCGLTTSAGTQAQIVWAETTPVPGYPTTGYGTVSTLDGGSSPTGGAPITVTTEPVLLSS